MNISTLADFFTNYTIPKVKEKPLTFLEIAKQPHYENVWSNIYAFYFDVNGKHGLKDLFIKSLLQVINTKRSKAFQFSTKFTIQTEFFTEDNGRIDLLLSNDNEAIIIENKVFHHLNNNLDDYWESMSQPNKQGIILSLNEINNIKHFGFINITHLELLNSVMQNFGIYLSTASDKFTIFLKDFYQNIINLSNPMDSQSIDFYYQHSKKINQAIELKESMIDYILSEVEKGCSHIPDTIFYKTGQNRKQDYDYYLSDLSNDLMYTIAFGDLLSGNNSLTVIIELQNDVFENNQEKLENLKLKLNKDEKLLLRSDFLSTAHYAEQTFKLTSSDFQNLNQFIAKSILESPLKSIFNKIEDALFGEK